MTWVWGVLASAALLWPDRLAGPFDGVPLDRQLEAVALGIVLPALVVRLRVSPSRFTHIVIVLLCAWKVFSDDARYGQLVRTVRVSPAIRHGADRRPTRGICAPIGGAPDPSCSARHDAWVRRTSPVPAWFLTCRLPTRTGLNRPTARRERPSG